MANIHLNFNFSKLRDAKLLTRGEHIVESMDGNTDFPTPDPPITSVDKIVNQYSAALGKAENGTPADVIDKNDKRLSLEDALRTLAIYCLTVTTDAKILAGSGFPLAKVPAKIGPLPQAKNIVVKPGRNRGAISVSVDRVPGSMYYEFQFTDAPSTPESVWQMRTSSKRKMVIDGLTSGKQYTFRVAAAGADPSRAWSEEVSSYVL